MRSGSKFLLQRALDQYAKEEGLGAKGDTLEKCYKCDLSKLPPELSSCFIQLQPDYETRQFLKESKRKSSSICLQFFYTLVHILLGLFLSLTAINGLLEKGKMFVFSQQQLEILMSFDGEGKHSGRILDIGSGDGHVTDKLKHLMKTSIVHVTEASTVMQRVLRQKGYHVLNVDSWHSEGNKYDLISCLNVLDRCSCPLSMLRQITNSLEVGGLLMIALVHPYEPTVENHSLWSKPTEKLPIILGQSWEEGVSSLWGEVLKPLGYSPMALSRVPYLCEGDLNTEYHALDDAVLVLKKTS